MQRHQQQVRAVIRHLGTYASWLGHLLACRRWRPPPPPSRHGGHSREGGGAFFVFSLDCGLLGVACLDCVTSCLGHLHWPPICPRITMIHCWQSS